MRSEEQIVSQAPILVSFGGKEYQIRLLVIKESREWRQKLAKMMGELSPVINTTTDTPEKFQEAMNSLLVTMPDTVVDLVFAYGKDLPRDEIEAVATDAEMAKAFESILEVAFPLARSVTGITGKLSR
jgi:uroporphyrinogen-III decarboxylase